MDAQERDKLTGEWRKSLREAEYRAELLPEQQLWEVLVACEGLSFHTFKGMEFHYYIRGYEMFIDRKEKSITRSTVMMAARQALRMRSRGEKVTGPKKLGTFGASYLYPIFLTIGII